MNIIKGIARVGFAIAGVFIGYHVAAATEKLCDKVAEKQKAKKNHEWAVRHGYVEDKEFDCGK